MRFDLAITKKYTQISRSRAAQRIKHGDFTLNGRVIKKPSQAFHEGDRIEETTNSIPFVSRGGLKLEAALAAFSVDPSHQICMDVGASTGGFTECLLNHGSPKVYAIDVGSSQLDENLRHDPRIVVMENQDIRDIDPDKIDPIPTLIVADVSFISLVKIWDALDGLSTTTTEFVVLFKPQFETEKKSLSKNGIVTNPKIAYQSMCLFIEKIRSAHYRLKALIPSPIHGKQGNVEFLLHIQQSDQDLIRNEVIKEIIFSAYQKGE